MGIGISPYDFTLETEGYPDPDIKTVAKRYGDGGGGPVPGAISTLAVLGCRTAIITTMGDDLYGKMIKEEFEEYGINTQGVRLSPDFQTLHAHIIVDHQNGQRTVILNQNEALPILKSQIPVGILEECRYLILDSRITPTIIALAKRAKSSGARLMFDGGSVQNHIKDLLPLIDYPVVSLRFVKDLFGHSNPERACKSLIGLGATMSGVTMGKNGSYLATNEEVTYIPSYEINVVDTTGAGDVYHGGVLYGLLHDWNVKATGQLASAIAALNSQAFGARTGIPGMERIREFFIRHGIENHPVMKTEV